MILLDQLKQKEIIQVVKQYSIGTKTISVYYAEAVSCKTILRILSVSKDWIVVAEVILDNMSSCHVTRTNTSASAVEKMPIVLLAALLGATVDKKFSFGGILKRNV